MLQSPRLSVSEAEQRRHNAEMGTTGMEDCLVVSLDEAKQDNKSVTTRSSIERARSTSEVGLDANPGTEPKGRYFS